MGNGFHQQGCSFFSRTASGGNAGVRIPLEQIYARLCRGYGWEWDYAKSLSELEILQCLEYLHRFEKEEFIQAANREALAAAAGQGDKGAIKQLNSMTREAIEDQRIESGHVTASIPLTERINTDG